MQCNAIQYNTIQYNTTQHNTTQHNTIQYNTIQFNTIQYTKIQYNTMQYNTLKYNTIQFVMMFKLIEIAYTTSNRHTKTSYKKDSYSQFLNRPSCSFITFYNSDIMKQAITYKYNK